MRLNGMVIYGAVVVTFTSTTLLFVFSGTGFAAQEVVAPRDANRQQDQLDYLRNLPSYALHKFDVVQHLKIAKSLENKWLPETRIATIEAVRAMGAGEYVPRIAKCLEDGDKSTCLSAIDALVAFEARDPKYTLQIAKLLLDEKREYRPMGSSANPGWGRSEVMAAATLALGELGATKYRFLVEKLLDYEDENVRQAATKALELLDEKS